MLYSCWDSIGRAGYELGTVHTGYTTEHTDRWVRCASRPAATARNPTARNPTAGNPSPASDVDRFTDQMDAGLLDLMRQWRAGTVPAR